MRRTRAILAPPPALPVAALVAVLAVVLAWALPASAHPTLQPAVAEPGASASFTLVVDSTGATFTSDADRIDVTVPQGFRLDKVADTPGWTATRQDPVVHFQGTLAFGRSVVFTFTGVPEKRGIYVFPVTLTSVDGATQVYDGGCSVTSLNKGALLFVGTGSLCPEPGTGPNRAKQVGLALVAAGFVVGAGYPFLRRLRRS